VIQQSVIMARQGVDIPLLENLGFKPAKTSAAAEAGKPRGAKAEKRAKIAAKDGQGKKDAAEPGETEDADTGSKS
jgi:YidC/Oxa1 family membrane protein insertase